MVNWTISFVVIFLILAVSSAEGVEKSRTYVVYLGEKKHEDPELTVNSHHNLLADIVGSKKLASDLTIYNYQHGFSGFAAKLTESQAEKIRDHPDVVHVLSNKFYKLQTTRTWDYLGVGSPSTTTIPTKGNMGDGMIIGVVDSGIWPESKSFIDEGLGPIPSRWKGKCVSGQAFNATQHCNKKIIGAQYFMDGFLSDFEVNMTEFQANEFLSPRDIVGHGTHVAGVAAGSYVPHSSYAGLASGTLRGGAPKAGISVYKACWFYQVAICSLADIVKAIDVAIHDGVDVLQLSVAESPPIFPEVSGNEIEATIVSIHAVSKGIPVVFSAGNDGSEAQTVDHPEPWTISVAASSIDRYLATPITLGNNKTIMANGLSLGNETGFIGLFFSSDYSNCAYYSTLQNQTILTGKMVLCFTTNKETSEPPFLEAVKIMAIAGARGIIIAKNPTDGTMDAMPLFKYLEVDYSVGTKILKYAQSTSSPTVNIHPAQTIVGGKYASTKIADFSSRGPNSVASEILKPDIAAPGVDILAAVKDSFKFMSGTSMAAPHVSGSLLLIKQSHPDWSPAALKSAIMTTAWSSNQFGFPIFAGGLQKKLADPFDMGAGLLNPDGAFDPGLVYDMDMDDYIHYFCAMGYDTSSISKVSNKSNPCPRKQPSILDVNLPSITIPSLKNFTTLKRTVTNVGPANSVYNVEIQPPSGTLVSVKPDVLHFSSKTNKMTFEVTVYVIHQVHYDYYNFGSLTWTDGAHFVRSPISVKTEVELPLKSY